PEQLELILGENGSGKTSFLEAILGLQQLVRRGRLAGDVLGHDLLTRWHNDPLQRFQLYGELQGEKYHYQLEADFSVPKEPIPLPFTPQITEFLRVDDREIFAFEGGRVRVSNYSNRKAVDYALDKGRSALSTMPLDSDNVDVKNILSWFGT